MELLPSILKEQCWPRRLTKLCDHKGRIRLYPSSKHCCRTHLLHFGSDLFAFSLFSVPKVFLQHVIMYEDGTTVRLNFESLVHLYRKSIGFRAIEFKSSYGFMYSLSLLLFSFQELKFEHFLSFLPNFLKLCCFFIPFFKDAILMKSLVIGDVFLLIIL